MSLHSLDDKYLQNAILEYLVYPLPYIDTFTKKQIKTFANQKINSLLQKKYNIKNSLFWPLFVYNEDGNQIFNFDMLESSEKNMFIAFI